MASKNMQRFVSILLLTMMVMGFVQPGNVQASAPADFAAQAEAKIEALVLDEIATAGTTDFFVWMTEEADLSRAEELDTKLEKGQFVFETVRATAERTQKNLRSYLDMQGVTYRPYYIVNAIFVQGGDLDLVLSIAGLLDVSAITANHKFQLQEPFDMRPAGPVSPDAIEPNLTFINVDDVWAMGVMGAGTVMAGNDTGLTATHPAIARHYRGCLNPPTCDQWDHNYNWWDAWDEGNTTPWDDYGHGTHTTGTMVGDDGGTNQIGVAPGAQTVHCKNMLGGGGDDAHFLECFEWDLAPWNLAGLDPDPAMAPDAVNNSWGYWNGGNNVFRTAINTLQASGVAVEVSAGNEGTSCSSLRSPGDYQEVLTTGSVDHSGQTFPGVITYFSSRGPSDLDGNYFPDIMAPGNSIRSSVYANSYEYWSGTSMAGPHATALVGLIWSACPAMAGLVDQTFQIIRDTAAPLTGQYGSNCGGDYDVGPNNDWGMGTIDALAAVQYAMGMCSGIGQLDGTVTDAVTADPVEGVNVTADWSGGGFWYETTDLTGYYTFTTLPVGGYQVTFEHPLYTTLIADTVVETGTLTTLDVELTPRGLLFGYVTDADNGFALEGATVEADDGTLATTDIDGYYEMYLDEGTHTVTASMQDYAPESADVVIVSGGTTQQDFALFAAVTFIPTPAHAYLDWGATDTLPATLTNRLAGDYAFEFTEVPGDFIPGLDEKVMYEMAPSIPADLTTGIAPEGYVAQAGVGGGIPEGPWEARTATPFAVMDNVYVDYQGMGYLVTGYGAGGQVGIYDPNANSWTTGATEPSPQIQYPVDGCVGQNEFGEGVVILFNDSTSGATTLHRYNIATNSWDTPAVPAGFPANGLWAHDTLSVLRYTGVNVCYISGGATTPGGGNTSALYEYHPDTNTVVNLGNFNYLSSGFAFHASWFVPWIGGSGAICVGGGVNASSVVSNSTQCYDIAAGVFNAANADLGTLPSGLWGMAEDVLYEGGDYQLWVANGADAGFALWPNSAYYSQNDGVWYMGPPPPTTVYRVEGTNIAAEDGCSFYVGGGSTGGFSPSTGHNRNFSAECPPTAGVNVPWLGEEPITGTVPADGSLPVTLFFTATTDVGVTQPGDYLATLKVNGDPSLDVPVIMTVLPPDNMGKVTGLVWDNCLDVPLEEVLVSIAGGDPITTTYTDENGEYTAWLFEGTYTLDFILDGYVTFSADVTIAGGETVVLDVALVPDRPCMETSPDMFEVWVLTDTAVFTFEGGLDLINNGNQPNYFELAEVSGEYFTTTRGSEAGQLVTFPAMKSPEGTAAAQGPAVPERSFYVPAVRPLAAPNVLLLAADDDNGGSSPIQGMLLAYGDLGLIDLYDPRYSTPSLAELQAYDVVVVWSNYTFADATAIGNVLADYVDSGGKVIDMMFALDAGWGYQGRFRNENYTALKTTGYTFGTLCLGSYDSGHPIFDGVTDVCEFYRGTGTYLTPDSTDVAYWSDNNLFVAVKNDGSVATINGYVGYYYMWTGQMDDVLHNAILWLALPQEDVLWFWEVPVTGTVEALSTENIGIYFTSQYTDTTPMPLGTYTAELQVRSDDSVNGEIALPVIMHIVEEYIIPTASFTADASVCLGEEVMIDNTSIPGIPPATTYAWDFGDGTTSNEEEPGSHLYANPGTYTIALTACNLGGCDTYTQDVEVIPLPAAGFDFAADYLTVVFTNTSTDADTYLWDFGDGFTETVTDPTHTYAAAGTYTVTLWAYSGCGVSMAQAVITVEAEPDVADLSLTKDGPANVLVGETFTYTLTLENLGPDTAVNVVLEDTLPAGVTFVSATAPCVEAGGVVTCDLGDLASGASVVINVVVTAPDTAGTLTNTAAVTSDTLDPDAANNSDSLDTLVEEEAVTEYFNYLALLFKH